MLVPLRGDAKRVSASKETIAAVWLAVERRRLAVEYAGTALEEDDEQSQTDRGPSRYVAAALAYLDPLVSVQLRCARVHLVCQNLYLDKYPVKSNLNITANLINS